MNLEEKANQYASPYLKTISPKEIQDAKIDFKNGYKECIKDVDDFIKANPKASATQITDYLNSL